jgi:leader peptidase (prepilin peptidase)/N-methyltransferase
MRMRSYSLLTIAIVLIIGFLLGGVSWAAARMLTAGTRQRPWDERVPLLLSGLCGAALLVVATLHSGGNLATVVIVAILAVPLLVTLLTDVQARLVFPVVLIPGFLAALVIAATQPGGVLPALVSGGVAAGVTALLVVLARWIWSSEEAPLGSGDILITAAIGAALGPDDTPRVLLMGMVLAAVTAGALLLTRRAGRYDVIPYGAFLCGAALVGLALHGGK